MAVREAEPLFDFREIVREIADVYSDQLESFTPDDRLRLMHEVDSIVDSFRRMYEELTDAEALEYEYDYQGDLVMQPADAVPAVRRVTGEEQPYRVYDRRSDEAAYARISRLFSEYAQLLRPPLVDRRIVLTSSNPTPTYVVTDETRDHSHRLSMDLYFRNRGWLNTLVSTANDPVRLAAPENDQQAQVWVAYAQRLGDRAEEPADTTAETLLVLDTLFKPARVVDYSPAEVVVAIHTQRVVQLYRNIVREQLRAVQKELVLSERARDAQRQRYETLRHEVDGLERLQNELRTEYVDRDEREKQRVLNRAEMAARLERYAEQTLAGLERRVDEDQRNSRPLAYRRFVVREYLDRETIFLRHLIDVMRDRRDNRRYPRRLPQASRFFSNKGFAPNDLIRRYYRLRDDTLQELARRPRPSAANYGAEQRTAPLVVAGQRRSNTATQMPLSSGEVSSTTDEAAPPRADARATSAASEVAAPGTTALGMGVDGRSEAAVPVDNRVRSRTGPLPAIPTPRTRTNARPSRTTTTAGRL